MPTLDMNKYGIDAQLILSGTICESPATEADPKTAPVVFLIDESHDDPQVVGTNDVVVANVEQVVKILGILPNAVVGMEHHVSGTKVTLATPSRGSTFHKQLLEKKPDANAIGADNEECLNHLDELYMTLYSVPVDDLNADIRHPKPADEVERERAKLEADYIRESNNDPCQWVRSCTFIETVLGALTDSGGRVAIINAGSNHNDHIWNNKDVYGNDLFAERRGTSLIRVRCPAHPKPLNCGHDNPAA